MSTSKKNSRGSNSRRTPLTNRPNRKARNRPVGSGHLHLQSRVETTLTLKLTPNKRERYPIPLSDLFNEASVGADTDIRMVGYHLDFVVASGNNCSTVSANISHRGPWVRASSSMDGFNQQFRVQPFSRSGRVKFSKRVLPRSEREFLSPHTEPTNFVVLQIDDPCGVIPGATIRIISSIHFIRPHVPTKLVGESDKATDLYEDQDVSTTSGGQPSPPASINDIPKIIKRKNSTEEFLVSAGDTSPFLYASSRSGTKFRVEVQGAVNKVGEFEYDISSHLQQSYTDQGFEGTILAIQ